MDRVLRGEPFRVTSGGRDSHVYRVASLGDGRYALMCGETMLSGDCPAASFLPNGFVVSATVLGRSVMLTVMAHDILFTDQRERRLPW